MKWIAVVLFIIITGYTTKAVGEEDFQEGLFWLVLMIFTYSLL